MAKQQDTSRSKKHHDINELPIRLNDFVSLNPSTEGSVKHLHRDGTLTIAIGKSGVSVLKTKIRIKTDYVKILFGSTREQLERTKMQTEIEQSVLRENTPIR